MYLARRVYGCAARVYELKAHALMFRCWWSSRAWSFTPTTKLCGPGFAAIGATAQLALAMLHADEDQGLEP